jgi:hypothetical protein
MISSTTKSEHLNAFKKEKPKRNLHPKKIQKIQNPQKKRNKNSLKRNPKK